MVQPKITRPYFPKGYVENPKSLLPWSHVVQQLTDAINYWLCTVRPDGKPHVIPRWAVMVEDNIYYDGSPETRHAKNIAVNPSVSLHLESGTDVVIVEGDAVEMQKPSPELGVIIAEAYAEKYAEIGYSPEPNQWDNGGLFMLTPRSAMAWTNFTEDPTKFVFETE